METPSSIVGHAPQQYSGAHFSSQILDERFAEVSGGTDADFQCCNSQLGP